MSAEILRRAAALMRERAEAIAGPAPSPWEAHAATNGNPADGPTLMRVSDAKREYVVESEYDRFGGLATAHIASWHPAVALAVADWLGLIASKAESNSRPDLYVLGYHEALAVARAYLGESA